MYLHSGAREYWILLWRRITEPLGNTVQAYFIASELQKNCCLNFFHYLLFKSLQLYNIITAKAFALNLLRMSSVHWSHFQNLYPSCYTWARLWGEGVERESENEVIIGTNSRWVFTVLFSLYSDSLSQKLWKVKIRSYGTEMEIFQRKSRFPETSQSFLFVPSSRAFLVPTLLHKRETISWGAKFDYFWRTFILVHT